MWRDMITKFQIVTQSCECSINLSFTGVAIRFLNLYQAVTQNCKQCSYTGNLTGWGDVSNVFSYILVDPEGCSSPLIKMPFPIGIFLRLGKARRYCVTKGNIYFCALLSSFLRFPSLPEHTTPDTYFSSSLSRIIYSLFLRILKLCTLLLNVERNGFVLRTSKLSPLANPFLIYAY